jgi:hypothetical protein
MDSQRIAGLLAGLIAIVVFAVVFLYMPKKLAEPVKPQQVELPKAPVEKPAVRGPVVRDLPVGK